MPRIRPTALVFLLAASLPLQAGAADWSDYSDAFPVFPCPNGWTACMVGTDHIDPDLKPDDAGRLQPSDARIDFFELEGTAMFSPFAALGDYPVEAPIEVYDDGAADLGEGTDIDDETLTTSQELETDVDEVTEADDDVALDETIEETPHVETHEEDPVVEETEDVAVVDETDETVDEDDPAEGDDEGDDDDGVSRIDPDDLGDAMTCDDLGRLEGAARLGRLTDPQIGCLESSFAVAPRQTEKDKISRVLLANAYTADKAEWERLARRHLSDVSQADPDICYALAGRLKKKGAGSAEEVIYLSDVALTNASVWSGSTYTTRVFTLHKLRAAAAQDLWKAAEERHAAAPNATSGSDAEKARDRTKTLAREWYDYAVAADKDTTTPYDLCFAAAGTADFCSGR